MSEKYRLESSEHLYSTFYYIESDDELFESFEQVCKELNVLYEENEKLRKMYYDILKLLKMELVED